MISISTDCGATWQSLFNKGGTELATIPQYISKLFFPQTPDQWKTEVIPLTGFSGNVLIRFRDVNDNGNNLYLDDVKIDFPTNTVENKPSEKFSVYPNPPYDVINVSGLPVKSEIPIMDLTSKLLLMQTTINDVTTIDIHKLPKGVYILQSKLGIKKIVKL